ncbi:peroxisomal membrane anchor protein conserved region-domain-containing protein [Xylariaceae sp. FL0804]|nr:peroxisomal membrane anchor protein conserved region-domain-containing protein [Xylariaceae sp. FL0804]
MTLREDVVTSAVAFLQNPDVVSYPLENKLSFLRSKNLTQEEIDAAFARTGAPAPAPTSPQPRTVSAPAQQQQQPYYGAYQPPPYGWQAPPPEPPKRDWRDWFIMATVMGGVGYGLYFITKRYIYPLVSPPTPEKLEQDKTAVDEQFDRTFATLEQLARDTEALKASEQERTEKLDRVLEELETFMRDAKSAGRRQDGETDRLREDLKALQAAIPKSMRANKDFADARLKEIGGEVKSLKSLLTQRMNAASSASASAPPPTPTSSNHLRPTSGNAAPASSSSSASSPTPDAAEGAKENAADAGQAASTDEAASASAPKKQEYMSSLGGRASPFGGGSPGGKASIPAWQMAASKSSSGGAGGSSSQQQSAGSGS